MGSGSSRGRERSQSSRAGSSPGRVAHPPRAAQQPSARSSASVPVVRQTPPPVSEASIMATTGCQGDANSCSARGSNTESVMSSSPVSYTHLTLPTICSV
eukprot:14536395-Alexandrium_andersonii.AAC.1